MIRLLLRFRLLQRLMGFTPPEPPLTGRRDVNGVKYDVDTVSRNETAISIQLPRHQLIVPPAYYRKDDETFQRDYRFGPLIDCLFKLGADGWHAQHVTQWSNGRGERRVDVELFMNQ